MVNELNIPDLTTEDVKLKIKSVRSRYSSELAKVLQYEKSGAGRDDIDIPTLFWLKQADLFIYLPIYSYTRRTSAKTA
jgi:hypothetical protein